MNLEEKIELLEKNITEKIELINHKFNGTNVDLNTIKRDIQIIKIDISTILRKVEELKK